MGLMQLNPGCQTCNCKLRAVLFWEDCDLRWDVRKHDGCTELSDLSGVTVHLDGPSYDADVAESGMIASAAEGDWTLTVSDTDPNCGTLVVTTTVGDTCSVLKPCCRYTTELNGEFSGIPAAPERRSIYFPSLGEWYLWFGDHTAANVAFVRGLAMSSGTKTPDNCYDIVSPSGDVLLGTGYEKLYKTTSFGAFPTCPTEADIVTHGYDYLSTVDFDIYLRFSPATKVSVIGVITASSTVGSGPPALTVGGGIALIANDFLKGWCVDETVSRGRSSFLAGLMVVCGGTDNIFHSDYRSFPTLDVPF